MRDVISNETVKEINAVIDEILTNIDDNVRNIVGAGNYSLPTIFSYTNYSGQTINVHGSTFRHEIIIDNADGNNLIGDICTVIGDRNGIKLAKAGVEDRHDTFANYWDSTFDIAYDSDTAINGYVFDMQSGFVGEGTGQSKVMSFKLNNLEVGKAYTLTFRGKFVNAQFVSGQESLVRICSTTAETPYLAQVTLEKDTDAHIYRIDFTNNTQDTTLYLNFWFYGVADDTETYHSEFIADDLIIAGMNIGIISRYIDYNGKWYPIEAGGGTSDLDAIELTYAEYQALSPAEKTDPDKIYFITDYPSGSGVVINPTDPATDTAETIEVDGTIYDFMDADAVHTADIGVAGGVAELDSNGKVPSSQLPTYPTVGNGTITIQKNGTDVDTFTTNQSSNKTVNITMSKSDVGLGNVDNTSDANKPISTATQAALNDKADTSDIEGIKTVTGNPLTITDAADIYAEELSIDLEPIQDLHGYDKPWVGGAGKNKLPMTLDGIKSINTSGTWSGNVYTFRGITYTVQTDSDGNVTSIKANGTASGGNSTIYTVPTLAEADVYDGMILNGCSGGSNSTYFLYGSWSNSSGTYISENDNMSGDTTLVKGTGASKLNIAFVVINNKSVSNVVFRPMIRLASETDPTFEPYTNISPIQGYDIVSVDRCGRNIFGGLDFANALHDASNTSTIDTTNKTVTYNRYKTETVVLFDKLKPNTTYTLILTGNVNASGTTNNSIALRDNEGGLYGFTFNSTTKTRKKITFDNVEALILTWSNGAMATVYYDECGLFEGEVTVEQFEEYLHQRISLQLGNKNLLPMTVEGIKAANTDGTWSGNVYTHNGVTYSLLTNSEGNIIGIKVNGTATASVNFWLVKDYTFKPGSYIITDDCALKGDYQPYVFVEGSTATNNTNRSATYITNVDIQKNIGIWMSTSSGANNVILYPMVRDANVIDPIFSPYNPTLGGMVYGGQLTLNDDGSAVFVGDRACVDLSNISFTRKTYTWSDVSGYYWESANVTGMKVSTETMSPNSKLLSDRYVPKGNYDLTGDSEIGIDNMNPRFIVATVRTSSDMQPTGFTVYPLATPFTIHLSAEQLKLLQGTNNVWSNAGDVTLKYQPDNVIAEPKADVQRLRDDVDVRLVGNACRNIFDPTKLAGKYDSGFTSNYDATTHKLTLTGKWYGKWICRVEPNTDYTFSAILVSGTITASFGIYTSDGSVFNDTIITDTFNNKSDFTFNSGDTNYVAILLYSGNNSSGTTVLQNIQLKIGSSPSSYEEYYPSNRELAEKIDEISQVLTTTDNANYNTALNISAYDATKPIFGYVSVISKLSAGANFYIPFSFMKDVVPAGTHDIMGVQGAYSFLFQFTDSPRSIKMVQARDANGNDATTNNTIKFYLYRNY